MSMQIKNRDICMECFNRIYDETFDEIKQYIALKCADPSYIPDILQDTYFEYYRVLQRKGTDYAKDNHALIFKIAKRKVFRFYSMKQKLSVLLPLFHTNEDGSEYCTLNENESENSCDIALNGIEAERIWSIINTYPADVRKIMYLYFSCNMSHSQIAEKLGCSLSNVKNKLYRTLAEIRKKENCDE